MTQKHFIAIAAILKAQYESDNPRSNGSQAVKATAEALADYFATINANFDRSRFLRACGVN